MRFKQYLNETKPIKIYKNKEDGVEAHVAKVEKGFSVSVKDIDSGEFLDTIFIYPDEKKAHKKAKQIVEEICIDIEVGDIILGGRFKNKRIKVKEIGTNEKGDITINGKPLLKYRLIPREETEEENSEV